MRKSADENLIRRELYNPNKFSLIFERDRKYDFHIANYGRSHGLFRFILNPDSFIIVPHFYWIITTGNGAEAYDLIQNFGNTIGIGNKLPSAPIPEFRHRRG